MYHFHSFILRYLYFAPNTCFAFCRFKIYRYIYLHWYSYDDGCVGDAGWLAMATKGGDCDWERNCGDKPCFLYSKKDIAAVWRNEHGKYCTVKEIHAHFLTRSPETKFLKRGQIDIKIIVPKGYYQKVSIFSTRKSLEVQYIERALSIRVIIPID